MESHEIVITYILEDADQEHLNDFLDLGWRIIVLKKERRGDEHTFAERIDYVLGATSKISPPAQYLAQKKKEKDNAPW